MKRHRFESEKELARVLVEWLITERWEVYQEVVAPGGLCDVVAKRGPLVWAIECKLTLNLDVIRQAMNWRHRAHFASIAVPHSSGENERILRELGLGMVVVNARRDGRHDIASTRCMTGPLRRPRLNYSFVPHLHEEQKTYCPAGGNRGGYFSPYKATCTEIRRVVTATPGITMKAMLTAIKHHYANEQSARGCLLKLGEDGHIPGVRIQRDGKLITLYPT